LADASAANGDRFFAVLRLKSADPTRSAAALAHEMAQTVGQTITPDAIRQTLHRARLRFAELLRAEVAASLPTTDSDAVDAELADLGLLVYCPS
jgi:hypothetical protein